MSINWTELVAQDDDQGDRDLKHYRLHNCSAKHRSFRTLAACVWRRTCWIRGTGPYATVAYCRSTSVQLHDTREEAEGSLAFINELACGGFCRKDHHLVKLVLPS